MVLRVLKNSTVMFTLSTLEVMIMPSKKLRITVHEVTRANDRLKAKATRTLGNADKSVRRAIAGIDDTEIRSSWRKAAQRHEEAI